MYLFLVSNITRRNLISLVMRVVVWGKVWGTSLCLSDEEVSQYLVGVGGVCVRQWCVGRKRG